MDTAESGGVIDTTPHWVLYDTAEFNIIQFSVLPLVLKKKHIMKKVYGGTMLFWTKKLLAK